MLNQRMLPEEVTVLAKERIDVDHSVILVRKGKSLASKRTLDLTTESHKVIKKRMQGESPWVLPSKWKPDFYMGRISSAHDSIVRQAAKAGISIKSVPYDFRHTLRPWRRRKASKARTPDESNGAAGAV